jgi:hypothetical protein
MPPPLRHGICRAERWREWLDAGWKGRWSEMIFARCTTSGILCVSQASRRLANTQSPPPPLLGPWFCVFRNLGRELWSQRSLRPHSSLPPETHKIPCLVQPRRINSLWPTEDRVAWTRISSPSVIHEGLCMIPTATRRLGERRMGRRDGQNHTQASPHGTAEGLCVVANLFGSHPIVHKPLRVTSGPEVLSLDPDLTFHSSNWVSRKSSCRMM